jgi:Na+/H+-dicarboxylate symporter
MRIPRLPLHVKILLGLVLGAVFGVIFSVDQHMLLITYGPDGSVQSTEVRDWRSLTVAGGEAQRSFSADELSQIITYVESLHPSRSEVTLTTEDAHGMREFRHVRSVEKERTPATWIEPLGTVFIRLLMMIAIPLVFASLLVGVSSLHDISKMARIGGKTIAYYLLTTALAISIGLGFGNALQPGHRMDATARDQLMASYQEDASARIEQEIGVDFSDYLVNLVPKNVFDALARMEMLQIIFFALMFGIALLFVDREKADRVIGFFDAVSDAMIKLVDMVMLIAPYAVFALIAATIAEFGYGILQTLLWYIVAVVAGLAVQTIVVYPMLMKVFARDVPLGRFLRELRPAQLLAFTTSSSAATLPVTIEQCEKVGAPKSVTGFVLPLGATINMDGTALYQGVAAVFIAQVFGMDLSLTAQLTVVLTATLASIGTAPVPGVGILMLIIVLRSVGVPETGIALILGVDRILDMCRTVVNVTSDATATMIVASSEKVFGKGAKG